MNFSQKGEQIIQKTYYNERRGMRPSGPADADFCLPKPLNNAVTSNLSNNYETSSPSSFVCQQTIVDGHRSDKKNYEGSRFLIDEKKINQSQFRTIGISVDKTVQILKPSNLNNKENQHEPAQENQKNRQILEQRNRWSRSPDARRQENFPNSPVCNEESQNYYLLSRESWFSQIKGDCKDGETVCTKASQFGKSLYNKFENNNEEKIKLQDKLDPHIKNQITLVEHIQIQGDLFNDFVDSDNHKVNVEITNSGVRNTPLKLKENKGLIDNSLSKMKTNQSIISSSKVLNRNVTSGLTGIQKISKDRVDGQDIDLDQLIHTDLQSTYEKNSIKRNTNTDYIGLLSKSDLFYCSEGCKRYFTKAALAHHTKICKKVFQSKRKLFDSKAQRALENDPYISKHIKFHSASLNLKLFNSNSNAYKSYDWRAESKLLRLAIHQTKILAKDKNMRNRWNAEKFKVMNETDSIGKISRTQFRYSVRKFSSIGRI
jgi:hypothetical protein